MRRSVLFLTQKYVKITYFLLSDGFFADDICGVLCAGDVGMVGFLAGLIETLWAEDCGF